MVSAKRIRDLTDYTNILPYASEMFGVYQPLLGWKSKRIEERFNKGFEKDKTSILEKLKDEFTGLLDIKYDQDSNPTEIEIKPGVLETGKIRSFDSVLLQQVSLRLPVYEEYEDSIWDDIITPDFLNDKLKTDVVTAYCNIFDDLTPPTPTLAESDPTIRIGAFERLLRYESAIAGALLFFVNAKSFDALRDVFYSTKDNKEKALELIKMFSAQNSSEAFLNIDNLDPQDIEHINSVALSPISVVHLFRQYFFELDTFLGPPVIHV